ITREHDAPAVGSMNGSAGWAEKVGAAVRLPRHAVEDAPRPKRSVRPAWNRSKKAIAPQPVRFGLRPELLELGSLAHDASDCWRRWIHEGVIDFEDAFPEFTGHDAEFSSGRDGLPGRRRLERHRVRPGLGIDVDAEESLPARGVQPER